jgi:hypothetical protein
MDLAALAKRQKMKFVKASEAIEAVSYTKAATAARYNTPA